ncbi:MAG: twin-arginine translocase subunit TatB [Rhodobacteraceae bacterium PARR1]|nr:MAG: twin-arginine translocase subunit TatB [Rhodobacteraceae bacterium PARR1]
MLDIGWSELILIGIVALIVVGPKDLPRMFHALGRMTSKARGMAREFQRAMDDAAKSTGLDEVRKDLNAIRNSTSASAMGIDALENAASKFEKWDPTKGVKAAAATANPTLAAAPVVTTAAPVVVPNMPPVTPAAAVATEAEPSPTAPGPAPGPATAALAEQKAAEQAAARQKALELQAKRTETAAKKFAEKAAEKAKADAAAAAAQPAAPVSPAVAVAETSAAEPAPDADAKPARKPPVRRKKSDA